MFAVITKKNLRSMKKVQLFNWLLIAFVAIQFTSCENEPLEGEFPEEDEIVTVEEGGFIATIEGSEFIAESASATMSSDNTLILTGITDTGDTIILTAEQVAVGVFDITAGLGNLNSGLYSNDDNLPYISAEALGGLGTLYLSEIDELGLTVTGTFSFTGARLAFDEDGNPILDGDGNPLIEMVEITSGEFNKIAYTLDDNGGETPLEDEFFAKVDGIDFIPESITTTLNEYADINVVKIVAVNADGAIMRIDIPEELGVGTFAMEALSDGTKLISLYNSNTGGENLTSNPGTITITKFNTNTGVIEATFAFTATDPINVDPTVNEVTEGSFAVDYVGTPGDTATNFTADVDGVFFNPDSITITESSFNGVSRINITVIQTDVATGINQTMGIYFPTDIEVGTYELTNQLIDGTESFAQYSPDFGNSVTFRSNPGVLTIVDYDQEAGIIEGTFSFLAVDILNQDPAIYEVTTGEFTLEL